MTTGQLPAPGIEAHNDVVHLGSFVGAGGQRELELLGDPSRLAGREREYGTDHGAFLRWVGTWDVQVSFQANEKKRRCGGLGDGVRPK